MLKPPPERTLDYLKERLRVHWRNDHRGRECFQKDREFERKCGEQALELLENFFLGVDLQVQPKQVEIFVDWTVAPRGSSGTPGGLPAGITLAGKIDRIDGLPDGRVAIIDYKTGRVPPSDEYLRDDLQVPVYWAMVEQVQRTPVASFRFVYLEDYREFELRPSPADIEAALERVARTITEIRTDSDPEPRVGPLCAWCGHISDCPEEERARVYKRTPGDVDLPF